MLRRFERERLRLEKRLSEASYENVRMAFRRLCKKLSGRYREERDGRHLVISCTEIPKGRWVHIDVEGFTYWISIRSGGEEVVYLDRERLHNVKRIVIRAEESVSNEITLRSGRKMFSGFSVRHPRSFKVDFDGEELIVRFM